MIQQIASNCYLRLCWYNLKPSLNFPQQGMNLSWCLLHRMSNWKMDIVMRSTGARDQEPFFFLYWLLIYSLIRKRDFQASPHHPIGSKHASRINKKTWSSLAGDPESWPSGWFHPYQLRRKTCIVCIGLGTSKQRPSISQERSENTEAII